MPNTDFQRENTFNDGATFVDRTIAALRALKMEDYIIMGALRSLLAAHFSEPARVESHDLRHLLWRPGDTTGIVVESVFKWRPELTQSRPGVLVAPNSARRYPMAMGDRDQENEARDDVVYICAWVGSNTLNCISGNAAQCMLLAEEVKSQVNQFAHLIRESLGLVRIQVAEKSPPRVLREEKSNFVSKVVVGWCYTESWALNQHARTLRTLTLDFDSLIGLG